MQDRRSSPRYPASKAVELRWGEGEILRGRLENFSVGGALVWADRRPPEDRRVSLCVVDASAGLSLDGTIIEVSRRGGWFRRASFAIRIKFSESCPYDFFKDHISQWVPPQITPEYESYWR